MKIIIGTKNNSKVEVVKQVFQDIHGSPQIDVVSHDAQSGVPEAPHGRETYQGALNRANECYEIGNADYYIGIESGLVKRYGLNFEEAWAVIIDNHGNKLVGYSSGLMLPNQVSNRMDDGELHNEIMKDLDARLNLPEGNRDTWSRYTGGNLSRVVSLHEALRNAIIQTSKSDNNLYKQ